MGAAVKFDRPITTVDVEELMCVTMDELEKAHEAAAAARVDAARAEATYRSTHARYLLSNAESSDAKRNASATHSAAELLDVRLVAAAEAANAAELVKVRIADLDALRTFAASARRAEHG